MMGEAKCVECSYAQYLQYFEIFVFCRHLPQEVCEIHRTFNNGEVKREVSVRCNQFERLRPQELLLLV